MLGAAVSPNRAVAAGHVLSGDLSTPGRPGRQHDQAGVSLHSHYLSPSGRPTNACAKTKGMLWREREPCHSPGHSRTTSTSGLKSRIVHLVIDTSRRFFRAQSPRTRREAGDVACRSSRSHP